MESGKGIGENMDNKRIRQLEFMFSYITGKSMEESSRIILETETGKAVQTGNPSIMYEQQTANISSIAMELRNNKSYESLADLFTVTAIVQSMRELKNMANKYSVDQSIVIAQKPELKDKDKVQKQVARKSMLQIKRQNQKNARRIEHANELKG